MAKTLRVPSGGGRIIDPIKEQTPLEKMTHPDEKTGEKIKKSEWPRTTICVNPDLYLEFQIKVKRNKTTVTAVLEKAMQEYISLYKIE